MQKTLNKAYELAKKELGKGHVADYIPELAKANPNSLGVSIVSDNGESWNIGDFETKFTIQSVGKTIGLLVALNEAGVDRVFSKVGFEATGDPFNSVVRLETSFNKIPFNPMINAGAISVCSCISGRNIKDRYDKVLKMARLLLGDDGVELDEQVYLSEKATGSRNRAMAYLMHANGVIEGDVEEHLDIYFMLCSLLVTCKSLAYFGSVLAFDGVEPVKKKRLIPTKHARLVRAAMMTAGMYDASGKFASQMGFPAKSGVGGGIMGAITGRMGVAVFSPELNEIGNSLAGLTALKYLSKELDLFVY